MFLNLLLNAAFHTGAIMVEEDQNHVKLVTRKLGATIVLAKLSREAVYQMGRTPDMPATLAEATAQAKAYEAAKSSFEREKVVADEPVPLPVPKRQKPQLTVIEGGVR